MSSPGIGKLTGVKFYDSLSSPNQGAKHAHSWTFSGFTVKCISETHNAFAVFICEFFLCSSIPWGLFFKHCFSK